MIRAMSVSAIAITAAFAGHGALDAFADQKAEEAIEKIRLSLPDGSELSYDGIDGDPYTTGATIEGLAVSHPVWGKARARMVEISGIELDDTGQIGNIGELHLDAVEFSSSAPLNLTIGTLDLNDVSGEGLTSLLQQGLGYASLASLDFEAMDASSVSVKGDEGWLAASQIKIGRNSDQREMTFSLSNLNASAQDDQGSAAIESLSWSSGLADADTLAEGPEAFLAMLPSQFSAQGLSLNAEGSRINIARLRSDMTRLGENGVVMDYEVSPVILDSVGTASSLGNQADISGQTRHNLKTAVTDGEFTASGDRLGHADVSFQLRGVDLIPGLVTGQPTPAAPGRSPAILGGSLNYKDDGLALSLIESFGGTTPENRRQMASGLAFLASSMTGGSAGEELNTIINEAKAFIIEPKTLKVELRPQAPVEAANLMLGAMMNPAGMPQLLGLSVEANR